MQTIRKSPSKKIVDDLRSKFLEAVHADKDRRNTKKEANRFYDGDQWNLDEKEELKKRGQPIVVINRIKRKVDTIIGMELKMPVDTKAFPRGPRDEIVQSPWSEVFRYIENQCDFDEHENKCAEDITVAGRGWYKTKIVWEGLDPEIVTERADDDDIFLDPYCKRTDLDDAKYIHESIWMDFEDAKGLWPRKAKLLDEWFGENIGLDIGVSVEYKPDQYKQQTDVYGRAWQNEFIDVKRKRVRVVSTQYREPFAKRVIIYGNGEVEDVTDLPKAERKKRINAFPGSEEFVEMQFKLNTGIFSGNILLEHKKDIKPWDRKGKFDYVLIPGYAPRQAGKKNQHYGLVKQLIDPQKEVNKRRSKMLHLLNTNRMIYHRGAFKDPRKARLEWAHADAWLEVEEGRDFKFESNLELAQSQFALLQESKNEIDATGIGGELEGGGKARSGRDFKLRHEAATQPISGLLSSLRSARKRVAMLWIDYVQHFWTPPKLLQIIENEELVSAMLDTNVKYDIIVEETPESLNLRSEEFERITSMAQAGIPIPPDLIIQASSLPPEMKVKIQQRFEAMQQAQAEQPSKA